MRPQEISRHFFQSNFPETTSILKNYENILDFFRIYYENSGKRKKLIVFLVKRSLNILDEFHRHFLKDHFNLFMETSFE